MSAEVPPKSAWVRIVAQIKLDRGCGDPRCAGYPRGISRALTFDHRPGLVKLFEISQGVKGKLRTGSHVPAGGTGGIKEVLRRITWQDILDEIDKCDVVCKNCYEVRNTQRAAALDAQL
jgi:hypothetical protein